MWVQSGCMGYVPCLPFIGPLVAVGHALSCYFADVSKNGQNPLLLVASLLCSLCVVLEYAFISRFKGVFSAFWGEDVYLYGLMSLSGLWGFCVRERLGGLKDCGVFALLFISLPLL